MRKIAIVNRKGGVGKTALTANLGHALALAGKRVSLVDLDPQGHLSNSFGVNDEEIGVDSVLLEGNEFSSVGSEVRDGLVLHPAGSRLVEVEQLSEGGAKRATLLSDACEGSFYESDFVLFDCPPSAGLLMSNGLIAVDEVVTPVTGDYLALEGLSCITMALRHLNNSLGKVAEHWVAMSRFNLQRRVTQDVMEKVKRYFPNAVLPTVIREAAAMAECPGYGQTIFEFRGNSRSAQEFALLADDIICKRAA